MADMIAIDMRMPTSCEDCQFLKNNEKPYCSIEYIEASSQKRPDWCPLWEVEEVKCSKKFPKKWFTDLGKGVVFSEESAGIADGLEKLLSGTNLIHNNAIHYDLQEVSVRNTLYSDDKPVETELARLIQVTGKVMVVKPRNPLPLEEAP